MTPNTVRDISEQIRDRYRQCQSSVCKTNDETTLNHIINNSKKHSRFRFVLLTTLVALFFLIHVTREVEFLENHNRFYNPHILQAKLIVVIHDGCLPRLFFLL